MQTTGLQRHDRSVTPFSSRTASGEPWSSSAFTGDRPTLVMFVKEHCDGCREFIAAANDPNGAGLVDTERLIMVITDSDSSLCQQLRDASGTEAVLVGSEAAAALRVPGAPFFSLISASGEEVISEGVAFGIAQVRDHCRHGLAGMDPSVPRLSFDA